MINTHLARMIPVAASMFLLTTPATATVFGFTYSGTVTNAENFDGGGIPGLPLATAHVGEMFFGNFSLDTQNIEIDSEGYASALLTSIHFFLPDQGVSEDFSQPGGAAYYTFASGAASIIGGRADYYRQVTIDFNLPTSSTFDPKAFYGKSGAFTFASDVPNGFRVEGLATVSAVPEPATWAGMIMGFGLIGYAARRRAKAVAIGLSEPGSAHP